MPRMIFVNLPVRDLAAATRFYKAIGCEKNEQLSDEKASSMVWSSPRRSLEDVIRDINERVRQRN